MNCPTERMRLIFFLEQQVVIFFNFVQTKTT